MKQAFFILKVLVLCVLFSTSAFTVAAATYTAPTSSLRLGDEKPDVLLLQKLLNTNTFTKIADVGAGSPGFETTFFGKKTLDAVKRFQNLYASEILTPNNLTAPTGFVGAATLKKLQQVAQQSYSIIPPTAPAVPVTPISAPSSVPPEYGLQLPPGTPEPIPLSPTMEIKAGVNPNTVNLEYALATLEALGRKQGMTQAKIDAMKVSIKNEAQATTTDFRKEFFKSRGLTATSSTSLVVPKEYEGNLLIRALTHFGLLHIASAATGVPFGGRVYFVAPCTCSPGNWYLIIQPLPPVYPEVLTYITGTQLYLSYNLPFSPVLLGLEMPSTGTCFVGGFPYCVYIPSEGHILPTVGSALAP